MSRGDATIERAADKLQRAAERAAAEGGAKAKLAEFLADDAEFVRKLKPSLIRARMRGELPTDGTPGEGLRAPAGPLLGARPKSSGPGDGGKGGGGPSPFVVVGVAFAVGIVLAKLIDWRGHAHPRL